MTPVTRPTRSGGSAQAARKVPTARPASPGRNGKNGKRSSVASPDGPDEVTLGSAVTGRGWPGDNDNTDNDDVLIDERIGVDERRVAIRGVAKIRAVKRLLEVVHIIAQPGALDGRDPLRPGLDVEKRVCPAADESLARRHQLRQNRRLRVRRGKRIGRSGREIHRRSRRRADTDDRGVGDEDEIRHRGPIGSLHQTHNLNYAIVVDVNRAQ